MERTGKAVVVVVGRGDAYECHVTVCTGEEEMNVYDYNLCVKRLAREGPVTNKSHVRLYESHIYCAFQLYFIP